MSEVCVTVCNTSVFLIWLYVPHVQTLLILISEMFFTAVCLLPISPPRQICSCGPNQDFIIIPGKQTVLVTINGITSFYFYIPPEGDVRSSMIIAYYYYPFVLCCTDTDQMVNIILFSGLYHLCLPAVCCPLCSCKWTPGIGDLLGYRYWPATTSCQMLFKFDVFTSFEQMKLASPAISEQAFLKMLEHRSLCTGRVRTLILL